MTKSILVLERYASTMPDTYRTIFKTNHGRAVFLSIALQEGMCILQDCFYVDRDGDGASGRAIPKKLASTFFPITDLLSVIGRELDKQFYGVKYLDAIASADESTDAYIGAWRVRELRKYRFLILLGEREGGDELPVRLRTRLKNKMHRTVRLELAYYKNGLGVVKQCCYCDRQYKRTECQVTPPMLHSCLFPYTKEGILHLVNTELCCDFTHILITDDPSLDQESNTLPLCGYL